MTENNFLFHKVSEKEKEEVKKEAKRIMDSFAKKLSKIPDSKLKEPMIKREKGERVEGEGKGCEINTLKGTSRKIMFDNAPNSDDDFIIAEKGGWK